MLLELVSCRTHSGLVHLLPVRVAVVPLGGVCLMMRRAMVFGSSAALRPLRLHCRAATARHQRAHIAPPSATESIRRYLDISHPHWS